MAPPLNLAGGLLRQTKKDFVTFIPRQQSGFANESLSITNSLTQSLTYLLTCLLTFLRIIRN